MTAPTTTHRALDDANDVLKTMVAIATDASRVAKAAHDSMQFDVAWKGKDDPVTTADREANALIVAALQAKYPGIPVVAEESAEDSYAPYATSEYAFFVDPIDGTSDFVEGREDFCVMVGLARHGEPLLGTVVVPTSGEVYSGGIGIPARRQALAGPLRTVHVTDEQSLAATRCAVTRTRRTAEVDARLAALGCRALVAMGSAGLKQMLVASGDVDLYVHLTEGMKLWDACAPHAILRAAGGELLTSHGDRIDYRGPLPLSSGIAAGNLTLVRKAIGALRQGGP